MIAPESRMILTEQRELRGEPSAVDQPAHDLSRTKPHTERGFGRPVPSPRHALRSARTDVCLPLRGWLRSALAARSPQLFPTDRQSERAGRRPRGKLRACCLGVSSFNYNSNYKSIGNPSRERDRRLRKYLTRRLSVRHAKCPAAVDRNLLAREICRRGRCQK